MSKGNIDAPQGSKLLGQCGFEHKTQTKGHSIGTGQSSSRLSGTTFGGEAHKFRGHGPSPTKGGQNIK